MSDEMPTEHEKSLMEKAGIEVQPDPVHNDNPSAHDLVAADMMKRKQYGLDKYGTVLQAGNGRNSLLDAYDETQDLIVYMRTELAEREELARVYDNAKRALGPQKVDCLLELEEVVGKYLAKR